MYYNTVNVLHVEYPRFNLLVSPDLKNLLRARPLLEFLENDQHWDKWNSCIGQFLSITFLFPCIRKFYLLLFLSYI